MALFDREGGIDSTTIVMLGNSLTENGKDWAQRIGTTQRIVNRGIIGDNTVGMTQRLYQITPYNPKAIFLMAGINDMVGNTTAEQVAQHVITLIEAIRRQAPQTQLFVQSILPIDETEGRWKTLAGRTDDIPFANMLIKAYCETHDLVFVDIFHRMTRGRSNQLRAELSGDGLHLSEQGYRVWAFELKKYLNKL
ncbi:MAG: serine acetyltransferase [Prevotella sp.]|nr:serine acetyltransferase [Prevotella sp.]